MAKGTIDIQIDPISHEDTERYRKIILELIAYGAFTVKSGSVTLHFDHEGNLMELLFSVKKRVQRRLQ